MKSEKNKITKQIGISLAIIGILFLAIVTLNLSKNEEIIIFCFMYGFMVFMSCILVTFIAYFYLKYQKLGM